MTRTPDEIPALDARAAALLATYRRGAAMPPGARARVQRRLRGGPSLADRRRTRRGWAVVLAVAAAVALVWAVGDARRIEAGRAGAGVMSPSQAGPPPQRSASVEAGPREAITTAQAHDATTTAGPGLEARRVRPRVKVEAEPDSLREETAILSRGWRALAAGDVAAASAAVREHDLRFAAGALTPEREALAAVAACAGDGTSGDRLARVFLAAHPRSPLSRRVREACGLTP